MGRLLQIIKNYGLIAIIVLALFLRVFGIEKSPPSLNWDEASLGYNAYSILKTGKDEFGKDLPLFLRSFDDYKPALYSYLSIPFINKFDLNTASVRMLSVISGTAIVIFTYLICQELFSNKIISLLASLFLSVEPWAIHFSRIAFEANLALALTLGGLFVVVKSKFKNFLSLSGVALISLSAYAYIGNQVLIIPLFLIIFFFYRNSLLKNKKLILGLIIILIITLSPLILIHFKNPESLGRLGTTSIFRENKDFSSLVTVPKKIMQRYFSYFSPINLFVRGSPEPTMHVFAFGLFYNLEFIFWIIGLYFLIKKYKKVKLLILLILIAPLSASITWNWFYPARSLFLFSLFSIAIGLGIYECFNYIYHRRRRISLIIFFFLGIILVSNISNLITTLLFYLPYKERGAWQYGMEQVITQISQVEKNYNQIIFETGTAQPHIFVLFYSKYPPLQYQKETVNLKTELPRKTYDFGKYKFRDVYWDKDKLLTNTLLVGSESSLSEEKIKDNPRVNYVFNVLDPEGNILSRLVGLK
jgi:4-amino-4-deoxy-L-arabinose transferase-like glycosyltransferase